MFANRAAEAETGSARDLLLLELAREVRRSRKKRADSDSDDESRSFSQGGGSSEQLRAFGGVRLLRKDLVNKPGKVIKQFEADAKEELGVAEGQAWTYRDLTRAIGFGKMRGMYRLHVVFGEILLAARRRLQRAQPQQFTDKLERPGGKGDGKEKGERGGDGGQ